MHRARRDDGSPWSDETPAPVGRDADTLPLGSRTPHWTQVDTAHDGTPVVLRDAPSVEGERSFLGPEEATEATGSRFDAAAPPTLPLGTTAATPNLPPTREVPSARGVGALSTALPPRPERWPTRLPSNAPTGGATTSPRAPFLVGAVALVVLAAVVFVYLVVAAPR